MIQFLPILGWNSNSQVLIVGCGFGWMLEVLAELGVGNTICAETSADIQSAKYTSEDEDLKNNIEAVGLSISTGDGLTAFHALRNGGSSRAYLPANILDEDFATKESRQRVRNILGSSGYDIFTDDGYLNTHTDAEAVELSNRLHKMNGVNRVIHNIFPHWLDEKTIQDWKNLLPNDYFIETGTWEFL